MPLEHKKEMPYYDISTTPIGTKNTEYTALITQISTDDPTITILNKTSNQTITWTRTATGDYKGTLTNAIDITKTWMIINPGTLATWQFTIRYVTPNEIQIQSAIAGTLTDGILYYTAIQIKQYT